MLLPVSRFNLDADGKITQEQVELLAADVREEGDGKQLALAKIVAGLLGVSSDEIFRRSERERRHKARLRNGLIGVLAILVLAATVSAIYAWQQLKTNEAFLNATLKRATEIVNTAVAQAENYGVPQTATLELLSRAEGLFNDMALLGRPTPELKYRKALMLVEFARNYAILGATDKRKARADEAYQLMTELANERANDPDTLLTLATTLDEQGDVQVALANLTNSLDAYGEALKIRERLANSSPKNIDWQRNLLFSYKKWGTSLPNRAIFRALGNFTWSASASAPNCSKPIPSITLRSITSVSCLRRL